MRKEGPMEIISKLAREYEFLDTLSDETKRIIAEHIKINEYSAGYKLINGTQSCQGFSFILKGILRVYRINDEGREVTLYKLKQGDSCFLTTLCVLSDQDHYAFAEVEEDAILGIIPMEIFKAYILEDKAYLKYIFKNLYGKFDMVIGALEKITFDSIEKRIIHYLRQSTEKTSGGTVIYTTHEKIAIDIGSSREVVSRALKALEKSGLITLGRGKIKILDLGLLEKAEVV
ncbi:MAG: cyclic nucleotide-binding protein [Clostridia bacterium]|jgi:CRP/FNR family transcriptional regulator|nr:cyclic nucleotide-binding protein [Clostridia bacterium]